MLVLCGLIILRKNIMSLYLSDNSQAVDDVLSPMRYHAAHAGDAVARTARRAIGAFVFDRMLSVVLIHECTSVYSLDGICKIMYTLFDKIPIYSITLYERFFKKKMIIFLNCHINYMIL